MNQNDLICESIKLVSSAKVPLPKNENSNFKIFKSYIVSDKHVAIIVNPTKINKKSVNLRIHSACFTGDIFHSLKDYMQILLHSLPNHHYNQVWLNEVQTLLVD